LKVIKAIINKYIHTYIYTYIYIYTHVYKYTCIHIRMYVLHSSQDMYDLAPLNIMKAQKNVKKCGYAHAIGVFRL